MSVRSHFEINHDVFDMKASDAEIANALRRYVNSAGSREAETLRRLGITRFWWGHHSCPEVSAAERQRRIIEPPAKPQAAPMDYVALAADLADRSASA